MTKSSEGSEQKNFETMLEGNVRDYMSKITEEIKDIQSFGNIIELIKVDLIAEDKQKEYFRMLEEKYKSIFKDKIKEIKENKELMNKAIKIIAELISKIFLFEKNNRFLNEEISSLDENIKFLIYIELVTTYNDDKYKDLKNNIYQIYLGNIETKEGRDNIIKLVQKLNGNDKKYFINEKLLEKCIFSKEEFFSNHVNYKIQTICLLNEELNKEQVKLNILERKETNKDVENLMTVLESIKNELDNETIIKKDLEKFLNIKIEKVEEKNGENNINASKLTNDESGKYARDKLELITLISTKYDPITKYAEYKSKIQKINEKLEKLKFIKDSLMIFHRNVLYEDIEKIKIIFNEIENGPIRKLNNEEIRKSIEGLLNHLPLCNEINKVKDFIFFKKIFENAQGKDEVERFDEAIKKLKDLKYIFDEAIFNHPNYKDTFRDIKEELGKKSENKTKEFIDQMIDYFCLKDGALFEDLKILFNSKKYENIVKSIEYFFNNFLDKKLTLPNNINLSEMNLSELKNTLNGLKRNNIYDYESNSSYYRLFTSFYEKKLALDFLKSKIANDNKILENELKNKLDPTNRNISVEDIDDTMKCLQHFKNLINLDNSEIIKYLQLLDEKDIKKFENFSKKFGSIIELDQKIDGDRFEEIYNIIQDANLLLNLDSEDFYFSFYYKINGKIIKINNFEELNLIKEKNKIKIYPVKIKKNEKKEEEKNEKDIVEIKCDKLIYFKEIISNIEIIYDKINILRSKGFIIPIVINIHIKYPEISYKLNNEEKDFNYIKDYLFKVENDYDNQISIIYEKEKYSRLLYGKLFRKVKQHQDGSCKIPEIIRYILNITSIENTIQEADNLHNATLGEDYEDQYNKYTKNIFDGISSYLSDLFKINRLTLKTHYENMLIKSEFSDKGISIKKCKEISMEEYILFLFMKKLGKLPIAQNILICSNETSIEEMKSFLYRAILCEYNTLFVIEILESFSNFQHKKMYCYIDKILSIKFKNYKTENEGNKNIDKIDKSKSRYYLDSYIVFVYKNLENENAFRNELEKYTKDNIMNKEKEKNLDNINGSLISNYDNIQDVDLSKSRIIIPSDFNITKNIKVITSDVCGLGKSFKIKKEIKEKDKRKYFHFLLGGKLTKSDIYKKISDLFDKIENDSNKTNKKTDKSQNDDEDYSEFNNVAIHLDLIETKETSLINEFLFSFLITRFYTNNGNIIYIPNNLKIYIEVPNSFENYLTKFGILKAFNIENIIFGESKQKETDVPMLPLELEKNIREQFERLNGFKNDKDIENFIKKSLKSSGLKEYSYHQIQTFIKLYLSQFESFTGKLRFTNSVCEDVTNKYIDYFSNSTKYFTKGGFQKLIM